MEKSIKRINTILGTNRPSVDLLKTTLNQLPEDKAEQLKKDLFYLAFMHWNSLTAYYRKFLFKWLTSDRDVLMYYLINNTILGALRFKPDDPMLLIGLMHILVVSMMVAKNSVRHLTFCLKISFDIPYTSRTLANYILNKIPKPSDILDWISRIKMKDEY